jgi:hypothetical protein
MNPVDDNVRAAILAAVELIPTAANKSVDGGPLISEDDAKTIADIVNGGECVDPKLITAVGLLLENGEKLGAAAVVYSVLDKEAPEPSHTEPIAPEPVVPEPVIPEPFNVPDIDQEILDDRTSPFGDDPPVTPNVIPTAQPSQTSNTPTLLTGLLIGAVSAYLFCKTKR